MGKKATSIELIDPLISQADIDDYVLHQPAYLLIQRLIATYRTAADYNRLKALERPTLGDRLRMSFHRLVQGSPSATHALLLLTRILEALDNLHSRSIAHEDLCWLLSARFCDSMETALALQNPKPSINHQVLFPAIKDICQSMRAPHLLTPAIEILHLSLFLGKSAPQTDIRPQPDLGMQLVRRVLKQEKPVQALTIIGKLNLVADFPLEHLLRQLTEMNDFQHLLLFAQANVDARNAVADFCELQIRLLYPGCDLGYHTYPTYRDQPARNLRDRNVQKSLVSLCIKLVGESSEAQLKYPYVFLCRKHASMRFLLLQRHKQQVAENDFSFEACDNFNSLILAHVNGTDSDLGFDYNLARIVIKELIEFGDMPSARDFEMIWRTRFGPTDIVGLILRHKMEIPRAIIRGPPKEANLNPNTYRLPQGVKIKRVYDGKSLQKMVQALMDAEIVGMDTEWRPKFVAGDGQTERTALFQFACYPLDRVYLVDMLAFNKQSRRERLMDAITSLLEDEDILKIGFDFRSDQRTLQKTYPELGADAVEIDNYVDLRSEKDEMARKANIKISGLSGFVSAVLGKTLDKKQQMSDWERRPLSAEQECYAAADAYCLIELYRKLYH